MSAGMIAFPGAILGAIGMEQGGYNGQFSYFFVDEVMIMDAVILCGYADN
jgi:hypothetical protein